MSAPAIRVDGAKCYGVEAQHDEQCYCGRPATRHIYYGTGCGNVCGIHARKILKRKRLKYEAPYVVTR